MKIRPFLLASPRGFAYIPQAADRACKPGRFESPGMRSSAFLLGTYKWKKLLAELFLFTGVPKGIRTPVLTVKG